MNLMARKRLTGIAVGIVLGGSAFAVAQDTGAGSTTGGNTGATGTGGASTGATGSTTGSTGTRADDDNDMDFGWIGLAGLLGLAGLAGRNRHHDHAHTTTGTTAGMNR